jgi:hypothetical protein
VFKSRTLDWTCGTTRKGINTRSILPGNVYLKKRLLERCRCEHNIEMNLKEMEYEFD